MGHAGGGAPQRRDSSGEAISNGGGVKGSAGKTPLGKQRLLGCASSELPLVPRRDRKKRSENPEPRGPPSVHVKGQGPCNSSHPSVNLLPGVCLIYPPIPKGPAGRSLKNCEKCRAGNQGSVPEKLGALTRNFTPLSCRFPSLSGILTVPPPGAEGRVNKPAQ